MRRIALCSLLFAGGFFGFAGIIYDNGPIITNPGLGYRGGDVSMATLEVNTCGLSVDADQGYRVADDFTVPAGGWMLNGIELYAYATNAPPGAPGWLAYSLNIWQGDVPGTGTPVFTTTAAPTITPAGTHSASSGCGPSSKIAA